MERGCDEGQWRPALHIVDLCWVRVPFSVRVTTGACGVALFRSYLRRRRYFATHWSCSLAYLDTLGEGVCLVLLPVK